SREEISKIERGLMSPLSSSITLDRLASSLNIKRNSYEWGVFFALAEEKVTLPAPEPLPTIFRTRTGDKVPLDKLDLLVRLIRS
ncbi:MAG: hypothetical protein MUO43_01775, partial [Desulfobacterales bacterium]|nr:hypothetical protein [Desulfobacterales bacterium]